MLTWVLPEALCSILPHHRHFTRSRSLTTFVTSKTKKPGLVDDGFRRASTTAERRVSNDSYAGYQLPSINTHTALKILKKFGNDKEIRREAQSHGITALLFHRSMRKLTQAIITSNMSMTSLQLRHVLQGIASKQYSLKALLPLFLEHNFKLHPSLKLHRKMKKISDLSEPSAWYPKARSLARAIIVHAGPTNSGKTHAAMQRFLEADSAVYCSPLRLLAREICQTCRNEEVACDLITGDEQDFAHGTSSERATKVACTVEMTNLNHRYDVAVIDEIQMLADLERGWAWTRALLGLRSEEIHVCGEERALKLISKIAFECGDTVTVLRYERLGKLRVKKNPVESLDKIKTGDCVVCFSRNHIYDYKKKLAQLGVETAMIYGNLPPETKLEEATKFNDPSHPCNVLVTTDAIGMGMNLNIRRIVFNDVEKITVTKRGERKMLPLTSSQALQISGRAGRYGSKYPDGAVTAMHSHHQPILHGLLRTKAPTLKTAGLQPSFEKIEKFAAVIDSTSLFDVLSLFISMCETDESLFFLCSLKEQLEVAEFLQSLDISLADMYTFCSSPVQTSREFVMCVLHTYASFYANDLDVTEDHVKTLIQWPPRPAKTKEEMSNLEDMYESLRLYLWLSYRFPRIFSRTKNIKAMRKTLVHVTRASFSKNSEKDLNLQSNHQSWQELKEFLVEE